MIAVIVGVWQEQIILRPVQFLMQGWWVPPAAIGLEEESQDPEDKDEEANPHQAHTRAAEEKDKGSIVRVPAAAIMVGNKSVGGLFDLCILSIETLWEDANVTAGIIGCGGMGHGVETVLG